jgi:3-oxoacyl-ACP reductase-like protein
MPVIHRCPFIPGQLGKPRRAHQRTTFMSIFGKLVSAIFGSSHAAEPPPTSWSPAAPKPASSAAPASPASPAAPTSSPAGAGVPGATGKPMSRPELEALIKKTASEQREDLNWRESIVDLMKLFKLDSGLGARKELAKELGYTGALDGSAEMNVWLHRQVMTKLAETGGKVPEHLKA